MTEEWKDVDGWAGLYQVSNTGRVRSLDRNTGTQTFRGRELKQYIDKDGYAHVTFFLNGRMKHYSVHRLVASAFVPNPNNFPQTNHKDENPINNSSDNLEWCDVKYNINYGNHKRNVGIALSGERNYGHKLCEKDIAMIRSSYIPGHKEYGQCALARRFGVSQSTIRRAIIGRTWKNMGKEQQRYFETQQIEEDEE